MAGGLASPSRHDTPDFYCLQHTAVPAADGREALDPLRGGHFDVVLTDRAMPHLSGDQLAAAIKQEWPDTLVILATGFGDLMVSAGECPPGVDAVIAKPVTLAKLQEVLATVIRSR